MSMHDVLTYVAGGYVCAAIWLASFSVAAIVANIITREVK